MAAKSKRKCHFTEEMKKEHPFLEKKFKGDDDSGDLFCRMCSGTFSISNGGQYDINRHLKSDMHKKAMIAKASTKPVTAFFSKNQPESQDLELAAREGLFAFHSVLHNHSFRSMDCTSKIIKEIYDTKFTCSRTKCEAIAVKILSPYILGKIRKELDNSKNDPKNELYLSFLLHQAKMFNDTVKLLEKEHACASEIGTILKSIINNLELRRSEQFIGTNTSKLLHNLIEAGEIQENSFRKYTDSFFETAIEYLNNWTADFEAVQFLDWIQLRKQVKWGDLEKVVTDGKSYGLHIDESALFNEYSCLKAYLTNEKLQELQTIPKIDERWQAILSHFETETIQTPVLESIVEFSLCLPGTNASVERSFSILNNIWSSEKSQLSLETLKGLMNLKINANCSCKEFYADLRKRPEIEENTFL
ncbi:putative zinc finger protein [Orchesella cincta]|uniref:Putative zinc finger protein n=1 Tax=Orchesella cincta TaxID=48709 RepID=A0A1D2MI66_ORCCI|nr:putative zinc finger protein [Orchesella cincta]